MAVGLTAVTFNATAVVPAGRPGMVRVTARPAPTLPRTTPVPNTVSITRLGEVSVNPAPLSRGVTALLGADAGLVPALLDVVTVNVYEVPLVSPVTNRLMASGYVVVRRLPT